MSQAGWESTSSVERNCIKFFHQLELHSKQIWNLLIKNKVNEVFSMEFGNHFSSLCPAYPFPAADIINHSESHFFLKSFSSPVFLIASSMTEVFIIYFTIQSFTLHLEFDWFSMFGTLIWTFFRFLLLLMLEAKKEITSEEVRTEIYCDSSRKQEAILCWRYFSIIKTVNNWSKEFT